MSTQTTNSVASDVTTVETSARNNGSSGQGSNPERESVFAAYRQWGYLEGDLDPLGFLRPRPTPELQHDGEYAREAREIYSSTIGIEINHIYAPDRRRWVYERMESPSLGFDTGGAVADSAGGPADAGQRALLSANL